MPHNKPSFGRFGVTNYTVIEPSNIRDLDQQASESINGDDGGTWNPSSPIAIGGSGVKLITNPMTTSTNFSGAVKTGKRSLGLILGDSDYPTLATTRTRSFVIPFGSIWAKSESQPTTTINFPFDAGIPGQVQTTTRMVGASLTSLNGWIPSYCLPKNCEITSVEFRFRVGYKPTALPDFLPLFRIFRVPKAGNYTSIASNELWDYPQWQASTNYSSLLGTKYAVRRTNGSGGANGWVFRLVDAVAPYLSGGAQPGAFSAGMAIGMNIADGNLTWQAENHVSGVSYFGMPRGNMVYSPTAPFGTSTDEFFAFGRTQTVTVSPNQNRFVDTANYNYGWDLLDSTLCDVIYTSVKVNLSSIDNFQAY